MLTLIPLLTSFLMEWPRFPGGVALVASIGFEMMKPSQGMFSMSQGGISLVIILTTVCLFLSNTSVSAQAPLPMLSIHQTMPRTSLFPHAVFLADDDARFALDDAAAVVRQALALGVPTPPHPRGRYWLVVRVENRDPTLEYKVSLRENMISRMAIAVLDQGNVVELTQTGIDAPEGRRWLPALGVALPVSLPRDRLVTLAILIENLPAPYDEVRDVRLMSYTEGMRAQTPRTMVLFGCLGILAAVTVGAFVAAVRGRGEHDEWLFVTFCFFITLFWTLLYLVPQKFLGLNLPIYQPVYLALAVALLSGIMFIGRFIRRWISQPFGVRRCGTVRIVMLATVVLLPFMPDGVRYPGIALIFIIAVFDYVKFLFIAWRYNTGRAWPFMLAWALLGMAVAICGGQILGAPIDTVTAHFASLLLSTLSIIFIAYGALVRLRESDLEGQIARRQAMTDPLTGLANRAAFGRLRERLEKGPDGHIIIGFIDVDGLKKINDQRGHERGDKLLVTVADALRRAFRKTENLFRVGGDEFILVHECAPGQSTDEVLATLTGKCQLAADAVRASGFPDTDLSAGFAAVARSGSISSALGEADALMYSGKRRKRMEEKILAH